MLRFDFVTLFPDMVLAACDHSMLKRAAEAELVSFFATNPRSFTKDKHFKVDESPYGGSPGMLIQVEPVALAVESLALVAGVPVVVMDPTGMPFTQALAKEFACQKRLVLLCGHYEGFDHRVATQVATHSVSLGDFVLTGGELPALMIADAVTRLIPGVLGSPESLQEDSHFDGLLSAPQYTRPEEFRGEQVPAVLLSGDHKAIARWRREQSLRLTRDTRPDLLAHARLDKADVDMLSS